MPASPAERLVSNWAPLLLILLAIAALPLLLVIDRPRVETLEQIRKDGKLRILTLDSPTTYYEGPNGPTGLEYDLTLGLAEEIGVELVVEIAGSIASIFPRLARGDAHFAAAGITVSEDRERLVRLSPPYQETQQQVVYLRGGVRPRSVRDLIGREIMVVAGSSHAERLHRLVVDHPDLKWSQTSEKTAEELLTEVWRGQLDLTITDSNTVAITRQHHPQLKVAFNLEAPEQLAWAFPRSEDNSLFNKATEYIENMEKSGDLKRLIERYYGAANSFNYVNVSVFRKRIVDTLPKYQKLFEEAERKTGIDWRLVAAQAYQESKWDPNAVSPTGVRGIMQITQATADLLKIDDREDSQTSIVGGARYLEKLKAKFADRIQEPDRTWLALASYNVGYGHLEDARKLTDGQGKDPDRWSDVKEFLPLLEEEEWHQKTKHGFARGREPVSYVTRIRTFYDVLSKLAEKADPDFPDISVLAL